MVNGLEDKGHLLHRDHLNSSVELPESVRLKTIGARGTGCANQGGRPSGLRICELKCGDPPGMWENHGPSTLACTWQDAGSVSMSSTLRVRVSVKGIKVRKGNEGCVETKYSNPVQFSYGWSW